MTLSKHKIYLMPTLLNSSYTQYNILFSQTVFFLTFLNTVFIFIFLLLNFILIYGVKFIFLQNLNLPRNIVLLFGFHSPTFIDIIVLH